MRTKEIIPLLKATVADWQQHHAPQLAAALAYFTVFSIAPLVIVIVAITGYVLGSHAEVRQQIFGSLGQSVGASGASAIRGIVDATFNQPRRGIIAQIVGWVVFLFGAIGLFGALQEALNTVWNVPPQQSGGLWQTLRHRVVSFGLILAIAFLLLVALVVNTALTGFGHLLTHVFPGFALLMKALDFVLSLGVITLLFALIFKYLPDIRIAWRDVWIGALLTAVLFVIGQFLIGWYLGRASVASAYGAFGSLVVFLLWVNYSAQILLFGAEFTQVYARRHGSRRGAGGASGPGASAGGAPLPHGVPAAEGRIVPGSVTTRARSEQR